MPKIRRGYKGAAVSAALSSGGVTSATQTSISLSSTPTTFPTGKFFVVVAPGTAQEEKMCVTLSGSTLTVVDPNVTSTSASVNGRGVDNTTARSAIAGGATVYPVATAIDFDEANELTSKYAAQGSMVFQNATTFAELPIGTAGYALKVNSGATAPEWGQLSATAIASNAITPAKIDSTVAGNGLNGGGGSALSVNVDGSTIEISTDTLQVKDLGITTAKLNDLAVTEGKIADSAVTSAKIADGTIVNADINASAAIALSKLASGALPSAITVNSDNIVDGSIVNADISASAAIALSKLETTALPTGITVASANIVDGTIVDADINASAAIALSKLATGTAGRVVMYNASGVATATALSGDVTVSNTGVTTVGAGVLSGAELSSSAALDIASVITSGNIKTGGSFKTDNTASGTYLLFENNTGTDLFRVDAEFGVYGNSQTGTLRNVTVNSSGTLGYSSSTIRTKQDITSYQFDDAAILAVEPKRFRYNDKVEGGGDGSSWQYGFIAEEAVAAGLSELCGFDETGQPDYFAYERMCVAQQQLIRKMWAKIEDLEARVAVLENK